MKSPEPDEIDLLCLDGAIWIAERKVGLAVYDFPFDLLLPVKRSTWGLDNLTAVARVGAVDDYDEFHASLAERGIHLIHTPAQHRLCSDLPEWYPLLKNLTPESRWYDEAPPAGEAASLFGWPIFLKGSRQTSRHKASLSIVHSAPEYDAAIQSFAEDRILHWQQIVLRRFVPLQPVAADMGEKIPASFEFRTFWWRGELAGAGPYFAEFACYDWTSSEREAGLAIAQEAARRVALPFVVVDIARTVEGKWIVIEINDAQESGYTGVTPLSMWQRIVEMESGTRRACPDAAPNIMAE
jgi:hypothetical protein